ncbi:MAG: hypothetical protein HYV09_25570 [Deltaproteobacteria bacterium]|nr:hypothetical protein [Deltaproteobacteria bacterium]
MPKLISSMLGAAAALTLVAGGAACSRSNDRQVTAPSPGYQRPSSGVGATTAGPAYGTVNENTNRDTTTPSGVGGGPQPTGMGPGIDPSGGSMGGSTDTSGSSGGSTGSGTSGDTTGIGGSPGDTDTSGSGGTTGGTGPETKKKGKPKSGTTK